MLALIESMSNHPSPPSQQEDDDIRLSDGPSLQESELLDPHEECSGCHQMCHAVGSDGVSSSRLSSSTALNNTNRMTDKQLALRAINCNIYEFDVSISNFCFTAL